MNRQEKTFAISDQYGQCKIIRETSFRQACIVWFRKNRGINNAKMFKTYVDGTDGKVYHIGYGYSGTWLEGGEVTMHRVIE